MWWLDCWLKGRRYKAREKAALDRLDQEPPEDEDGGAGVLAGVRPKPPARPASDARPFPDSPGQ